MSALGPDSVLWIWFLRELYRPVAINHSHLKFRHVLFHDTIRKCDFSAWRICYDDMKRIS